MAPQEVNTSKVWFFSYF